MTWRHGSAITATLDRLSAFEGQARDEPVNMSNASKPVEILIVEDNEDDALLTMDTLTNKENFHVTWVEDGEDALAFLRKKGKHASARRPSLILLDLTLPSKGGLEVLTEIKQDPDLRRIPVVILSHSTAERDIVASYDRHANCYITKTGSLGVFQEAMKQLERFWLSVVLLPTE